MSYVYVTEDSLQKFANILKPRPDGQLNFPEDFINDFYKLISEYKQIKESTINKFAVDHTAFSYTQDLTFRGCTILKRSAFSYLSVAAGRYINLNFPDCEIIRDHCFYRAGSIMVEALKCRIIEDSAFAYAEILKFSNASCSFVGQSAFFSCSKLSSITIGPAEIGSNAFCNCKSLQSFIAKGSSQTNEICRIHESAFKYCNTLCNVALRNCLEIGSSAFYGCPGSICMYLFGSYMAGLHQNSGIPSAAHIYVPTSMVQRYRSAAYWAQYSSNIFANQYD